MSRPFAKTIHDKSITGARRFPKTSRLLRSKDFRRVYAEGARFSGPFFAAFFVRHPGPAGAERAASPRIGFTASRALGKSVARNRAKRRMREAVRLHLGELEPQWEIVINPRRAVLNAPFRELTREVERLFSRCKG